MLTPPIKPARKPGLFNAKQLRDLDKADAVVTAARKPDNAAILAAREIAATFVDDLAAKVQTAREQLAQSKAQKGDAKDQTDAAHDEREHLIVLLQNVQSAARQKFGPSSPLINSTYYGSMRLRDSYGVLKQATEGILLSLQSTLLPGITPAVQTEIRETFDALSETLGIRGDNDGGGSTDYERAVQTIAEINAERQQIQFAANGAWPAADPLNHEIRRNFQIPADKNFVG